MSELLVPQKLETIEVDVKNKIFRINGKDFGKDCQGFTIRCNPGEWNIAIELEATVRYVGYDRIGEKKSDYTHNKM